MWSNKNFMMLFSGQIVSFIGIALFTTSLPYLVIYLDGQQVTSVVLKVCLLYLSYSFCFLGEY
ncbi:hypothetical protein SAMN05421787_10253 [Virgibacillus pantothenticus]|uniref:Uncharacterized protein n=1 Tax=Virgibacillus pantothenticus TaxID=1473 RepID=A0A0L0QRD4_VIRPA|nr:hypothetical protein AFK71_05735 [Virgibacillus pantothenticus]SIS67894.1 hypothetical protein SAMN05421787_10253 [Virgibacillus pantothenticus]